VIQKFFIGTEKCEKLELITSGQLNTLVHVARTHPTSLQQLLEVRLGYRLSKSLHDSFILPGNVGKENCENHFKVPTFAADLSDETK
jgi:hypothetical protein